MKANEKTALQSVIDEIEQESKRLEKLAEEILERDGAESENLAYVYECIEELDLENATKRAAEILHGLGFTAEMQQKMTKDFSGTFIYL